MMDLRADIVEHMVMPFLWLARLYIDSERLKDFHASTLFKLWLVVSSMFFFGLMVANMLLGAWDRFYLVVTTVQLLLAIIYFALVPENCSDTDEWDHWMEFTCLDLTVWSTIDALLWAIGVVLLLKTLVAVQTGVNTWLTAADLLVNLVCLLTLTAVPWIQMDLSRADGPEENDQEDESKRVTRPETGVGWRVWFMEATDAVSLIVGFVQFAKPGMEASWEHHLLAFFYFLLVFVFCVGFALLSISGLCGIYGAFHGKLQYTFTRDSLWVIQMVLILDIVTDVPLFAVTLFSRSYVGNAGFTFNVVANVVTILRAVYLHCKETKRRAKGTGIKEPMLK